ncbi:MAG TPA: VIT1/CCC1 transporter family protein [Streptosporangiaceae bacterium]|nr:VIT1/CCC1 transporter family protein [Streptosporangiaceae bacterium]
MSEDEVSDVDDDFDYLPGEQRPAGARVHGYPYGGPPRTGHTGPQPRVNGTGPLPRVNGTGSQPRLNGPASGTYPPANGGYAQTDGNGRQAPRYLSAPGYPTMTGPGIPGYPLNGQATAGHPATLKPPAPGYPPASSRAYPAYPPPSGHAPPGYAPANGQARPGYPPAGGRQYPGDEYPGYPASLIAGDPDDYPGYSAVSRTSAGRQAAAEDHAPAGKRVMGRLVLLPKALPLPGQALREHRDVSGGWLRPAVFGAMDGLVTNSSLIAGVGGGGGARAAIVLTGIAGLIAGAFSMATGEYISVTSQNELTQAEVELERMQHRQDRAGKLDRLTEIYMDKGVSPNLAEAVARQISADEDRAVATHVREELGIDPEDIPSPRTAAAASFAAFTVGALLPLSPFLLGVPNLKLALVIAAVAAIVGGAAVAKLTDRSMLLGGLRQFVAAFLATGMAFAVGHVIGGHIA